MLSAAWWNDNLSMEVNGVVDDLCEAEIGDVSLYTMSSISCNDQA